MQVQWKYIETTWNNLTSTNCFLMFLVCQDLSQFKSRWTDWRLIQHDPTKSVAKEHQQTKNHVMTSLQSTVIHSSKSTWVEMSWVPVWVSIASDTRRDSFLRSSMAGWHDIFKLDASFILSQLWHWLPSKQKYVTDCCIAAIFRVAFLSFLFSKDSLWLLPFSSSSQRFTLWLDDEKGKSHRESLENKNDKKPKSLALSVTESTHWSQGGMRKWDSSDGYVICPCCSKKWVRLESGTSTQNRPFQFRKLDFETAINSCVWTCKQYSTNQQAKSLKTS